MRGGDEKGRMGLGWSLGLGGEAIMSGRRLEASAWAPGECRALLAERGWPRRKKLVLYGEGALGPFYLEAGRPVGAREVQRGPAESLTIRGSSEVGKGRLLTWGQCHVMLQLLLLPNRLRQAWTRMPDICAWVPVLSVGHRKGLGFGMKSSELESRICPWAVCSGASLFPFKKSGRGDSSHVPEML